MVLLLAHDAARERQRHLAVVGRLAGDRVIDAAVAELAQAAGIELRDLRRRLLLDARAQAVADHLPQQATGGAGQAPRVLRAWKAQRHARLAPRLGVELRPVESGELCRRLRRAGEAAGEAALGVAGEHHLVPLRVQHHAARRAHQRHAGGDVVLLHAVDRDGRDAVARRDARQAIGDARHRDVARRHHGARPGLGLERRGRGRPDDRSWLQHLTGKITVNSGAIAADLAGAFGPGDGVGTAVGRIGRVHHAEHRLSFAQERDRDRRAAPARGVLESAVVRIDQPHPAGARAGRDGAFLAAELRGNQRLQRDLQPLLDLAVERAAAAAAARAPRRVELGAQPLAFGLYRGDHFRECVGWRHIFLIRIRRSHERVPCLPLNRPAD